MWVVSSVPCAAVDWLWPLMAPSPEDPPPAASQPPAGDTGPWAAHGHGRTCGFVSLSALIFFCFDENVRPLAFEYSEMEPEVYYKSFSFKSKFRIPPSGQRYHELSTNVSISNLIHNNLEYLASYSSVSVYLNSLLLSINPVLHLMTVWSSDNSWPSGSCKMDSGKEVAVDTVEHTQ